MDWASSWENSQNCCAYTILCGFLLFISLCVPVSCCGDGLVHIYVHISDMDWGKMLWAFRVRKPLSMGSFLMERIFRSIPNGVLTAHAKWLPGVQLRHSVPPMQYIYRRLWGLVGVRLSWLSGRALEAQASGVLGLTPGDCWPFHFPLFSPHNIYYFQHEARCSDQLACCL